MEVYPPHTHNIGVLFNLIQQYEDIPRNVCRHELNKLTDYSTQKRYPGEEDEEETTDEDYLFFLQITIACFNWIKKILNL